MRHATFAFAASIALACTACATTEDAVQVPTATMIANAVAAADRPADARALDEGRKPAELLSWLGLEPGMIAADLITGEGYWAEIMGRVVGQNGKVIAYQPDEFYADEKSRAALAAMVARVPQVSEARYPFKAFAPPAQALDFALINLSYHDLYWQSEQYKIPRTDPDAYLRGLYNGMKPGGIVGVVDHVGLAGDTRKIVDDVHRIDPAVVRADFERAGFRLVGASEMLANPADDHTKLVFDPAVRGKTDRFVFKFVRPR